MKVKIKKSTNTLIELLVGKLDLCITKKLPTIFDYNPWYKNWIYFTKGKKKNHK